MINAQSLHEATIRKTRIVEAEERYVEDLRRSAGVIEGKQGEAGSESDEEGE